MVTMPTDMGGGHFQYFTEVFPELLRCKFTDFEYDSPQLGNRGAAAAAGPSWAGVQPFGPGPA
jgi:hypothetical protein